MQVGDFAIEVINAVLALFNEKEDQFARQIGAMCPRRFQGDDGGTGLAGGISTRTGKTIDIDNPAVVSGEDWEPCIEILAENLVLGSSVRLKLPNCFFRYGHVNIKTKILGACVKRNNGLGCEKYN